MYYATGCFVAFLGDISILKSGWNILLSSSKAFSLSTPVEDSETTWKKATKCNKNSIYLFLCSLNCYKLYLLKSFIYADREIQPKRNDTPSSPVVALIIWGKIIAETCWEKSSNKRKNRGHAPLWQQRLFPRLMPQTQG